MNNAGMSLEVMAVGLAIIVVLMMAGVGMILASKRRGSNRPDAKD